MRARIREVINGAMAWVDTLRAAYAAATEQVRRLLNQALYRQVFVGPDGVLRVEYTEGFAWLLGEEDEGVKLDSQAIEGSTGDGNVSAEVLVLRPDARGDHEIRPGRRAGAYHRGSSLGHGWNVKRLVEVVQLLSNPDHPAARFLVGEPDRA